jgi:hypothetical protein
MSNVQARHRKLGYLLLPPPNVSFSTSDPVEEVAMVRDEAADLAWVLHNIPPTWPDVFPRNPVPAI